MFDFALLVLPLTAAVAQNVMIVLADDLSEQLLDSLLAADLLPNTQQRFVDEGIRFSNAYVSTALCCPSRATFGALPPASSRFTLYSG